LPDRGRFQPLADAPVGNSPVQFGQHGRIIVVEQPAPDFLDIGIRDARWPTFNVADIAVSTGALLLAWVLWSEDSAAAEVDAERAAESTPSLPSARPTRDTGT